MVSGLLFFTAKANLRTLNEVITESSDYNFKLYFDGVKILTVWFLNLISTYTFNASSFKYVIHSRTASLDQRVLSETRHLTHN